MFAEQVQSSESQRLECVLTKREMEICGLIAEGYSNKEIAKISFVSHG